MNNIKVVACAAVAITVVGITIFDQARKITLDRKERLFQEHAAMLRLRDTVLAQEANLRTYHEINERWKNGEYVSEIAMEAAYDELYQFNEIAVRIDQ